MIVIKAISLVLLGVILATLCGMTFLGKMAVWMQMGLGLVFWVFVVVTIIQIISLIQLARRPALPSFPVQN